MSMTFMDLTRPETIPPGIALYNEEFPGMFRWAGEVNLVKQALFPNQQKPATVENIRDWAPFMQVLRERDILITIHSDLGNDAEPTKYLHLFEEVLRGYPDDKIVWAHMGLSKELSTMNQDEHLGIVRRLLDEHPKLTLDLSWRVLEDLYFSKPGVRRQYVALLNHYPTRAVPGTDFVASADKTYDIYETELEVTSRIDRDLDDTAFRQIALGQNYFTLLGVPDDAPRICGTT
jgi:Amidohydrolase